MRTKEEILKDIDWYNSSPDKTSEDMYLPLILETMLDIRELLKQQVEMNNKKFRTQKNGE